MDRRSFLKLFGGAVAAAAVDPTSLIKPPERRFWQVGIGENLVSFDIETQPPVSYDYSEAELRMLAKQITFGLPGGMSWKQLYGRTKRLGQADRVRLDQCIRDRLHAAGAAQPDMIIFDEAHRLSSKGVVAELKTYSECRRKWSREYTPAANTYFQQSAATELGVRIHEMWEQWARNFPAVNEFYEGYAKLDAEVTARLATRLQPWVPPEPSTTIRDSFRKFWESLGISVDYRK